VERLWIAVVLAGEAIGTVAAYAVGEALSGDPSLSLIAASAYLLAGSPLAAAAIRGLSRRRRLARALEELCAWEYYTLWGGTTRRYCLKASEPGGEVVGYCLNAEYGVASAFRGTLKASGARRLPWDYACFRPVVGSTRGDEKLRVFEGDYRVPHRRGSLLVSGTAAEASLEAFKSLPEALQAAARAAGMECEGGSGGYH
jgi:hypothetical protein